MTTTRLSAALVPSSRVYTLALNGDTRVGQIAHSAAQYEANLDGRTLEVAVPVSTSATLDEIDLHSGDRLALLTHRPQPAQLPPLLQAGDIVLRFTSGDFSISSRGRKNLMMGKPDETQHIIPDVDLRCFVPPKYLNYVSRLCLRLDYDAASRTWYAARTGQTRVKMNEYELRSEPVPLNADQWLRFYRAADDSRPIGEMRVTLETITHAPDGWALDSGDYPVSLLAGLERAQLALNASYHLRLGQIKTALALYHRVDLPEDTRLYRLRLVAAETPLSALNLESGHFLYTPLRLALVRHLLTLRDVRGGTPFVLSAGLDDEDKWIGCRAQANAPETGLDVDVFDLLPPHARTGRRLGRVLYRAADQTWWVAPEGHAALYVNHARVAAATPLTSGDLVTLGERDVEFEALITARME